VESDTKKLPCPCCEEKECPIHDKRERRWRHLNFWQYETQLIAQVPRVKCKKCGVHQVKVPWAREGSGFTLLFEAMAMRLAAEMAVNKVGEIMGEKDKRIWGIIHHYVGTAWGESCWDEVSRIAVDETSRRKGHKYVTVFLDLDSKDLLFMTPGKNSETIGEFSKQLVDFHGSVENINEIAMDMSRAFQRGAADYLPDAKKVFDRFHVMQMAGVAFDEVRKSVAKEFGGLEKGAHWALRGNVQRLNAKALKMREDTCAKYNKIGRAMALKEALQDLWNCDTREAAKEHFNRFYSWARRCRLEPFKKLAKSLKKHLEGILDYYNNRTTSAAIEALNGKLQLARRRARGYRNFENFKAIAYWIAGNLEPATKLPNPLPVQS
ncbi:MAG TPA: ISL3 family transposase, partial [Chromatiaceae bacterium]|nr:ISL3 family transposase [Chromatiaceae bacterium]